MHVVAWGDGVLHLPLPAPNPTSELLPAMQWGGPGARGCLEDPLVVVVGSM